MLIERNSKNMKKIKTSFQKVSLAVHFQWLIIITALMIASVTIFVFQKVYEDGIRTSVATAAKQTVSQLNNMISNYTNDVYLAMDEIVEHIDCLEDDSLFWEQLFSKHENVVSVTVYDKSKESVCCWCDGLTVKKSHVEQSADSFVYSDFELSEGDVHISNPYKKQLFKEFAPLVVTFVGSTIDDAGRTFAIAIDVRFAKLGFYLNHIKIGKDGYCYIVNDNSETIYFPEQIQEELSGELLISTNQTGTFSDEGKVWNIQSIPGCDWNVVGVSYIDELIIGDVKQTVGTLAVILIIILVVSIGGFIWISKIFSRSTNRLIEEMKAFEHDADNYVFQEVQGAKEISVLSESFGSMVEQIQHLMTKIQQEQILLRKSELNALQAQINPHFLYNTLDAISWMCEMGETYEAKEMVNALASLFRISISKGHELISVEKEIEHAENYLKIQKFRYQDKFTYEFVVDKTCLHYMCNKITLQPILENAIYHGIHHVADDGHIRILIASDGDEILFVIDDNGIGMSKEKCQEILEKDSGNSSGVGIKNVNDRIKIYFGEKYGITIASEEDVGTSVTIRMPKIENNMF